MMPSMKKLTPREALERAVKQLGGEYKTAKALGHSSNGRISAMLARGQCGPSYVLRLEELTGVSRHDLRPDIFSAKPR